MAWYDPAKVSLLVNNVPIVDFAKGTMVKVTFNEDRTNLAMGGQGGGVIGVNRDRSFEIEFTTQNHSPSNAYMEYVAALHDQGQAVPVAANGPFGGGAANEAAIKTVPGPEYSDSPDTNKTWTMHGTSWTNGYEAIANASTAALQAGL